MRRHFVKRPVFASTQAELTIEDLEDIDSEFTSDILFEGKDEAQHRLEDQGYKVVGGETGIDDIVSLGGRGLFYECLFYFLSRRRRFNRC